MSIAKEEELVGVQAHPARHDTGVDRTRRCSPLIEYSIDQFLVMTLRIFEVIVPRLSGFGVRPTIGPEQLSVHQRTGQRRIGFQQCHQARHMFGIDRVVAVDMTN